jgi:uncharacterized protein (DUF1501 family)
MTTPQSRRQFLRVAGALATAGVGRFDAPLATALAGLGAMASQSSHAADSSGGYKALVCLFMNGGNDSHNWIVPVDATGYASYAAARQELTVTSDRLRSIATVGQDTGRAFGVPLELEPLRKWYGSGQLGFVSNVGPLVRPMTRSQYLSGAEAPAKLFSHNDQASTWQSLAPEGAASGWGGRMGDLFHAANSYPVFTAISAAGNAVFLSGTSVTQYQVSLDGPVAITPLSSGSLFGAANGSALLQRTISSNAGGTIGAEYAAVTQRAIQYQSILASALAGVAVPAIPTTTINVPTGGTTTLDKDSLARQLRVVAQMIVAGQKLGMRRQVFMVSMGGFDTHANQMRDQPWLMTRVAQSTDYFLSALSALGVLDNVVLFSGSDFGRALLSNGSGSDHGWGGHHFVAGGPVHGGAIHGRFPNVALGSGDDIGSGRLLPAYSVSQYAAPLGRWFGLSAGELNTVLPGLSNFNSEALAFV